MDDELSARLADAVAEIAGLESRMAEHVGRLARLEAWKAELDAEDAARAHVEAIVDNYRHARPWHR